MDDLMAKMLEKMDKGRYNLKVCSIYMNEEEGSINYTISGAESLYEALDAWGGYEVEEVLQSETRGKSFYHDIEWDPESGCFFAYTGNPKAVVLLIEAIEKLSNTPIDEEKWKEFKNHPLNRVRLIV